MAITNAIESTGILVSAIAGYLAMECKRCGGMGEVTTGIGSDRVVDGVKYAGQVLRGPCPACGPIRQAFETITADP